MYLYKWARGPQMGEQLCLYLLKDDQLAVLPFI